MSSFDSLTVACEGWFDKPLCDLPAPLRQRIGEDFSPMPWDRLTTEGRRSVAQQIDYYADPALEPLRQFWWEWAERKHSILTQITEWEAVATPTALDLAQKETRLAELQQELTVIEAEVFVAATEHNTADQPEAIPIVNAEKEPEVGAPEWRSRNARNAANARHEQPGGSRDKRSQMLLIWATGKYSSRDLCAEQECAALDMSFSAARKALINAPDPIRC